MDEQPGKGPAESPDSGPAAGPPAGTAGGGGRERAEQEHRRRLALRLPRIADDDDGLAQRLAQQWAQMRVDRRPAPAPIPTGPSNFSRAQVPWGVDLAAAWAWRLLVICAASYLLLRLVGFFSVISIPLAVALLVAALVSPIVAGLHRLGLPRGLASISVVIGGLGLVALLLTFAGQQVATGATDLADQTVKGLGEIKTWLKDGPLNASDSQINDYIDATQQAITEGSRNGGVVSQVSEVGSAVTHVFAGFFIVLFATYFFLADGERIWAFLVRIAPRAAREHVDSSGRVAWVSLTQFVRATVIVALVDAIGIAIVAAVLGVPFVLAIGVLVFLGSFVPMIGATIAGSVAVLVALVDQGPITALLMLAGVIVVQQVEGHVLQPFLLGRWVSVHPLAVIVAIACGVVVAGVAGALVAVPLAAAGNAVVAHLAANTAPDADPVEELQEDYEETGAQVEVPEDPESPL
ncbi:MULTISPECIES: AI-2E family transporter [unclassified Nocardioides]|uniref:AI-2E family transporter n=1 Tax=unclassified Nocardioides TaxID=2615069 RepID=UPI002666CB75|nr:AI-2E family transporter [Nocardioides sp. Arc9.136]WKN49446.1 AI-2E family transporter [Nocardioides sp. Arc9.136]